MLVILLPVVSIQSEERGNKERLGKNWFAICSKMVFSTEAIVEMLLRSEIRLN